jgi:hypothetical protein
MGTRAIKRDEQGERNLLAARRIRLRRLGVARLANGTELRWTELLEQVAAGRRDLDAAQLEAVVTARVSGASWERISLALGGRPTGEALRKKYARTVRETSSEAVRHAGLAIR